MKLLILTLLFLALCCTAEPAQRSSNWPTPPEGQDKSATTGTVAPTTPGLYLDTLQLQRDAKELLALSQALQPDIDHVAHGILPKDTIEKLKRIEKLSKHLRSELTR